MKARNYTGFFIIKMCNGADFLIRQVLILLNLHGRNLNVKHERQNQHNSIMYSNYYTQLEAIHYPRFI